MKDLIIKALIGLIAGVLGGSLGIGGAVVIIPAMVFLLGYSQPMAQGTTLVMLSLPVSALAAWQYYKAGNADVKTALFLAVFFLAGGFVGGKLAHHLPQDLLRKVFAILIILIGIRMLFMPDAAPKS